MKSLSNALRFDGLLVSQLGENFVVNGPGIHYTAKRIEYDFMQNLIKRGFDRMEDYTEGHGGFLADWKYKILFKCGKCTYARWHATQANVELEIKKRSKKCVNDCNLFRYFDGATMMGYQYVSRVNEAIFCRDLPQKSPERKDLWCENRHGYDPELKYIHDKYETLYASRGNDDAIETTSSLATNFGIFDAITQNIILQSSTLDMIQLMSDHAFSYPIATNRWGMWKTLRENYCTPFAYMRSSSCYISLHILPRTTNSYANDTFHSNIWDSLGMFQNVTSPLQTAVYNPYISRNHLNLQWMSDLKIMPMVDDIPDEYVL